MVLGGLGGQFIGARLTFVVCGVLGMLAAVVVLRSRRGLVTGTADDATIAPALQAA
jgi:hypothetical protein